MNVHRIHEERMERDRFVYIDKEVTGLLQR